MPNIEIINANTTIAEQACHGESSTGLANPGPQIPERETNWGGTGTPVCRLVDSASGSACSTTATYAKFPRSTTTATTGSSLAASSIDRA